MQQYDIQARSWRIPDNSNWPAFFKKLPALASHYFLVLRDENQNIIAQLHGLATDRLTGEILPIGKSEKRHCLKTYHITSPSYMIRANQKSQIIFSGSKNEVLNRWHTAVAALDYLNAQDLNYPAYGFKCFAKTINSNSVYQTLCAIMDIQAHKFRWVIDIGFKNLLIDAKTLENIKYKI